MSYRFKTNSYTGNVLGALPAPFSSVSADKHNPVFFNINQRRFIYNVYKNHVPISNTVNSFIDHVLRNNINVIVNAMGKQFMFDSKKEKFMEYYSDVLLPAVRQMFLDWILYGYTRVKLIYPHERTSEAKQHTMNNNEFPMFVILPEGSVEEFFYWDRNFERIYKMQHTSVYDSSKSNNEVENGMLLILYHPDDNGMLTSPLARATSQISTESRLWTYYTSSAYTQSRQTYVFTPESGKLHGSGGTVTVYDGQASVYGTASARKHYSREVSVEQYQAAAHAAEEARKTAHALNHSDIPLSTLADPTRGAQHNNLPPHIQMAENNTPWDRQYTAPPGHRLQQPPRTNGPENFLQVISTILREVQRAIGLPPDMMSDTTKKHAANVDLIDRQLRNSIQAMQKKTQPLLHKLMKKLFEGVIDRKIYTHSKNIGKDDDSTYLSQQKASVSVEVEFSFNPMISPELLFTLHEKGVISTEHMQKFALDLLGMPKDSALKNPDVALAQRKALEVIAISQARLSTSESSNITRNKRQRESTQESKISSKNIEKNDTNSPSKKQKTIKS